MAIHHYSVHSPLQSPDNLFLLANEIPTKKRVLIVPLLEREKGWGVGKKHLQKCINLYLLHPHPQDKKKGGSTLHSSHWLHENSIPKLGCHYF